ncbi:CUB domain-containing protein 2-like [Haliotis asinina]|uniref:CUB domain-containing protein 2-like n=1 Tax=Haliotis asinina TaxID=109174 RepID=UPI0035320347
MERWRRGLHLVLHGVLFCSTTVQTETTTTTPGVCGPLQLTAGAQHRYLSSPGYPAGIQRNLGCIWDIKANEGERVRVVVLDVNILNLSDCKDDYVKFFDGIDPFSSQLEVLCTKWQQNLTITSSARYMRVELKTDFFVSGRGFEIMYSGGDFQVQRHRDVTGEHLIQLFSPGYPGNFEGKYHLTWRISTGFFGKILEMIVKESHLPYSHKCGTDYLEAHDGYDQASPSLAKWCGDEKPSKDSSGSNLFLVLHASSIGSRGIFKINFFVKTKPQEESDDSMKTTTILLSCIAVVLVMVVLLSVYKIRQRRYRRSSHTNRAFVATTMSSNPALRAPNQAVAMSAGNEIELPPYTAVSPSQPPPSYESLDFGPNSGKQ